MNVTYIYTHTQIKNKWKSYAERGKKSVRHEKKIR